MVIRPQAKIGVLGLQGGVREHATLLRAIGATPVIVKRPQDLTGPDGLRVDGLVLPGGESSTMDRLLRLFDMQVPLRNAIAQGLPTLGTCAGLILLASNIDDPAPRQQSLGVLDITVQRNAYGPQLASREARVSTSWGDVSGAFIRAPQVTRVGEDVRVAGTFNDTIVAVETDTIMGISFHPELTGDPTVHEALVAHALDRVHRTARRRDRGKQHDGNLAKLEK